MTAVRSLAIVGVGAMGAGIAYVGSAAGLDVALYDADEPTRNAAAGRIAELFDGAVKRGKATPAQKVEALGRTRTAATLAEAVENADLVIEAVPERLMLKQGVFAKVEMHAKGGAVFATNTSSLSITEIARELSDPGRVVGMHFFNPVHAMRLVEIVRGDATREATVAAVAEVAARMGKTSIVVRDTPGFATSRLGVVLGLEAMRMLEQGVASAEDIDRAMELGYNHPMGPLRLTDLVGLDVRFAVAEHLHRTLGSAIYEPPDILRQLVRDGKLGQKTGEGFFRWESGQ